MADTRGYRKCVRTLIYHSGKILIGDKIIDGKYVGPEFPGGGIEEGDGIEVTVIKECLEEVGIAVTDVVNLGVGIRYDFEYKDPERRKMYRGGEDVFCAARFIKVDRKLHDSEGDGLPFKWYSYADALSLLKNTPDNEYRQPRVDALETLLKKLNKTNGVYHW